MSGLSAWHMATLPAPRTRQVLQNYRCNYTRSGFAEVTITRIQSLDKPSFWRATICDAYGSGLVERGNITEILEFHPTSDLWHVREQLAAMDWKSAGRWSREGECQRGGMYSRADFEASQKRVPYLSGESWPESYD